MRNYSLLECLESILMQTYQTFEVICIDDGSEDSSWSTLSIIAKRDQRIKLFKNECNKGLSYSRNRGMDIANGKYILFVDSDDTIRKDTLELLVNKAERYSADIVQFDYHHLFEENVEVWSRKERANYHDLNGVYKGKEFLCLLVQVHEFEAQVCIRLWKREFIKRGNISFYEGIVHEDFLFTISALLKASRIVCCDEDLYTYRKRKAGITNDPSLNRSRSFFVNIIEILKIWEKEVYTNEVDESISEVLNYIYSMYLKFQDHSAVNDSLNVGTSADKWIYNKLCKQTAPKREFINFTDEIINLVCSAVKIHIYGAGNYGKELYDKLAERDIFVESFIVSDPDSIGKLCKGRCIILIDYLHIEDEALIIVAVSPSKTGEIVQQLRERGFRNYILLNDREDADTIDYWNEQIDSRKIFFFSYGSGGQYADHGKYITEALMEQGNDYEVVWALRDAGSTVTYGVRSIPAYDRIAVCKEAATAAIWVSNDPLPPYLIKREGQIYIQTKHWASITLKRFYLDDRSFEGIGDYYDRWRQGLREMDYCLVGSKFDEESCRRGFEFDGECVYVGSPRSDAMFHESENKDKVYSYYHIPQNNKLVMYAPTFRYREGTTESISPEFGLDYYMLRHALSKRLGGEWTVLVRMHPQIGCKTDASSEKNIIDASGYPDSQELVSAADLLISDYSSIMFEPAFVGKPVFLFAPDYMEYIGKKKELLLDYDSLPFPRAASMEELTERIYEFDHEQYKRNVIAFLEKYDVHEDGHAGERAADFILKVIQERDRLTIDRFKAEFLDFCDNHKKRYLYGAGTYGKAVGIFLKNLGYDVAGYITTNKSETPQLLDVSIRTIYEWGDKINDAGILICVGRKYYGEVSRALDTVSCTDKFRIEQKLYQEMVYINHTASPFQPIVTNPKNKVISLYYHRVTHIDSDPWSMAIIPDEFERHLKYLSENFKIVRFEDDWSNIEDKAITITFDDGYYDFYSNALPLLEKYQVPATIFISTANIDTDREFWWDRLERLLWHSRKVPDIIYVGNEAISTAGEEALRESLSAVRLVLKESYTMEERERFLDELEEKCEGTVKPDLPDGRTMTKEEIRELSNADIITIGAHTESHAALAFAEEMEQRREIEASIKYLEALTGKKVDTFSYPYGSYNESAIAILKECGIKRCRTIAEDIVKPDTDPLLTPGINAGPLMVEELAQRIANLWNDRGNE